MKLAVCDRHGKTVGEVEVSEAIFGLKPHRPAVHEALVWQMAGRRLGTHATKTRGDVRGGGRKPWRQKGTGRARAGTIRSPLWEGGGIIHGPQPRNYAYHLPRKVRRLALRSLLSAKAAAGQIKVVAEFGLEVPRASAMAALLRSLGVEGKALLCTAARDPVVERSAANLPGVKALPAASLNVADLLHHDAVVVTPGSLTAIAEVLGE